MLSDICAVTYVSVTYEPFKPNVVILNVFMLSVVAPCFEARLIFKKKLELELNILILKDFGPEQ
jgi:hypothetical protein